MDILAEKLGGAHGLSLAVDADLELEQEGMGEEVGGLAELLLDLAPSRRVDAVGDPERGARLDALVPGQVPGPWPTFSRASCTVDG